MADTVLRVVYENQTYDLELLEDIPLRLDISAVESQDIGTFTGVGSQQFVLPGTKVNNKFFNHAYEIGSNDVPAFYDTIQGYLIYEGEALLAGQFQLLDVLRDQDNYVSYKCSLQDSSVQFKDKIQSQLLIDGEWDQYNHEISIDNVISSWNNGLFSGSIFYPVVDYGTDNPDDFPTLPRVQLGDYDSPNSGDINSTATPMRLKQFLPAIKARDVLDIIFKTAGYRATGSFMESDDFNQTYILPKASEKLGIAGTSGSLQTFNANPKFNYLAFTEQYRSTVRKTRALWLSEINFDYGDNYSNEPTGSSPPLYGSPSSSYVAPVDGTYTFEAQISYINPVNGNNAANVSLWFCNANEGACSIQNPNSVYHLVTQRIDSNSPSGLTISTGGEMELLAGEQVKLMYSVEGIYGGSITPVVSAPTILRDGSVWRASDAPLTFEDAPVSMSLQFDQSTKSIDVVQGLIEQFNLVFYPADGYDKVIEVETFDEWMWKGRTVDWTDKYQTAERISITHTVDEQNRELLYAAEDDTDRFSVVSIDNAPNYQYGTRRILSDSNIPQGSRKIGSYFGPTVLAGQLKSGSVDNDGVSTFNINSDSEFAFPHLYKFDNREQKSFKFRPRLGYKVDNQLPIVSGDTRHKFYIGLPGTEGVDYRTVTSSYATLANVSSLPVTGSAKDLHNDNNYGIFASAGLNLRGGTTNYDRYWKNYTDSLYWEGARKLTIDIKFTAKEYKDIKLNDKIFIKDQAYRINKISGFNASYDDVVTVELIRLFPAFSKGPDEVNCLFTVSGSYSEDNCPTPSPTPTPNPIPSPNPSPTPGPSPSPAPVPQATPPACSEWDLVCNSSANSNCTFYVACCDGTIHSNIVLLPGSEVTYCATNAYATGLYGSVENTTVLCSDDCFIGGTG